MHRFYLPPEKMSGSSLTLHEGDAHHAVDVLRLRKGEEVTVLDGAGREVRCEVESVHRRDVLLKVCKSLLHEPLPYSVTLIQAVPKGKTFETIIQKATELGVAKIIPLLSSRVVVHLNDESTESKIEKWRHVAIEAIKQCGSAWLPQIEKPLSFPELLKQAERFDLSMVGFLGSGTSHPRTFFEDFAREHQRQPKRVALWVGPEGDFSPEEVSAILSLGTKPITMGPLVLRSDTAAIYGLSFINYELQTGHRLATAPGLS
jgi:16S rRNA (uracil1498-N3)-methyltransferase